MGSAPRPWRATPASARLLVTELGVEPAQRDAAALPAHPGRRNHPEPACRACRDGCPCRSPPSSGEKTSWPSWRLAARSPDPPGHPAGPGRQRQDPPGAAGRPQPALRLPGWHLPGLALRVGLQRRLPTRPGQHPGRDLPAGLGRPLRAVARLPAAPPPAAHPGQLRGSAGCRPVDHPPAAGRPRPADAGHLPGPAQRPGRAGLPAGRPGLSRSSQPEHHPAEPGRLFGAAVLPQCCPPGAPRSPPSPADLPHLARICQLVDGMPLGLVLAAGWLATCTPAEIAAEIERSLDFLSSSWSDLPERQRSLRATLDHSWQLLTADERQAFQKLSVFQGAFTRQAAEQVAQVERCRAAQPGRQIHAAGLRRQLPHARPAAPVWRRKAGGRSTCQLPGAGRAQRLLSGAPGRVRAPPEERPAQRRP